MFAPSYGGSYNQYGRPSAPPMAAPSPQTRHTSGGQLNSSGHSQVPAPQTPYPYPLPELYFTPPAPHQTHGAHAAALLTALQRCHGAKLGTYQNP